MISKVNIRSYEVSIWTLQDSFITVLKYSDLESKGQTQDGHVIIKDDGTHECTFTIPMYIYEGGTKITNPAWYSVEDGVIVADMRKIKVIFNKFSDDEAVEEFLITKVSERHEGMETYCDVESESLAFHELGKQGYKISLNQDDYIEDWSNWADNGKWKHVNGVEDEAEPRNTIDYWMEKIVYGSKWRYSVQMDWSGYNGAIVDSAAEISGKTAWRTDKIYEDAYVASWSINANNTLSPSRMVEPKEKERLVDSEESNRYNLTQTIAETFGVFCKYKYYYDDNYHIIDREIIFYNNFVGENDGIIDLTYPYNSQNITREMDGTDLVTKMYVKTLQDNNTASGLASIMDTDANRSREDYLLNFDYLYSIGAISTEQYKEIPVYEATMRALNIELLPIEDQLITLNAELIEQEAKQAVAANAMTLDQDRITAADNLLNNLTGGTGTLDVTAAKPEINYLIKDYSKNDGSYCVTIKQKGVYPDTVRVFKSYNTTTYALENEIKTWSPQYDEYGNVTKLVNFYVNEADDSIGAKRVYMTYTYEPDLQYKNVKRTWTIRLGKDEAEYALATMYVDKLRDDVAALTEKQETLLKRKKDEQNRFERLMGPALREGTWQPDDEYTGYGDKYQDTCTIGEAANDNRLINFIWDSTLFDDEQNNFYNIGAEERKEYYPCINLSRLLPSLGADFFTRGSFIFTDVPLADINDPRYFRYYPIGSTSQLGFLRSNSNGSVIPVLIVTGIDVLNDSVRYTTNARLGIVSTTVTSTGVTTKIIDAVTVTSSDWINNYSNYTWCYPRLEVNSSNLVTTDEELSIVDVTGEAVKLKNYEDYYILNRDDTADYENKYYITLRPSVLLKNGSWNSRKYRISYMVSNTPLFVYLDAIQVLKENAYPKVSYTIDVALADKTFSRTAYKRIAQIAHINDSELKFENVMGYISEIDMDLDHPWEDQITIKNYKTKFEDLFTSIVAQTEQMKKSSYIIGMASKAFTTTGELSTSLLQGALNRVDLNYAFNNGTLTIDEKKGIWGTSDSGVVAFRGGGIFTATEKDSSGNWIWNTGIVPQGINASLITTGQLDTNSVRIYAGDDLKFQLNGEGLFAYKSWLDYDFGDTTSAEMRDTAWKKYSENSSLDPAQYVVHNAEGLFLVAKNGALVLNEKKTEYIEMKQDVNRVEISWDGLVLRNYNNERTFYANPDNGNLIITGQIQANSGWIGGKDGWIIEERKIHDKDNSIILTTADIKYDENGEPEKDKDGKTIYNAYSSIIVTDGTTGNQFIKLSPNEGFVARGISGSYFEVNSSKMGFYNSSDDPLLYYSEGNLYLKGTLTANSVISNAVQINKNGEDTPLDTYLSNAIQSESQIITDKTINDIKKELNNGTATSDSISNIIGKLLEATSETITADLNKSVQEAQDQLKNVVSELNSALTTNVFEGIKDPTVDYDNKSKLDNTFAGKVLQLGDMYKCTDVNSNAMGSYVLTDIGDNGELTWTQTSSLTTLEGAAFSLDASKGTLALVGSQKISIIQSGNNTKNLLTMNADGISIASGKQIEIGVTNAQYDTGRIIIYSGTSVLISGNEGNEFINMNQSGLSIVGHSIIIGTSSSNSAIKLNTDGITLGTDKNLTLSGGNTVNISGNDVKIAAAKNLTIAGGGRVLIGSGSEAGSLEIASKGILTISHEKFMINTAATGENIMFQVGKTTDKTYMSFSLSKGLIIQGQITATEGGTIGGWNIGSESLYNGVDSLTGSTGIYMGPKGFRFGDSLVFDAENNLISLNNVTISDSALINSLKNQNIFAATSAGNLPSAEDGSLGVVYSPKSTSSITTKNGTIPSDIALCAYNDSRVSKSASYFGIKLRYWNVHQLNGDGDLSTVYARTGAGTTSTDSGLIVDMGEGLNFSKGQELVLQFTCNTQPNGASRDQMTSKNSRNALTVQLYAASKYNASDYILIGESSFLPADPSISSRDQTEQKVVISANINSTSGHVYAVFYSKITHTLLYILSNSVTLGGSLASGAKGIYYRHNGEWTEIFKA